MRDRQPTKVLENGALRYGVYDETGALLRYEYLALEDAPSDVGTDLSKANLLTDDTETALFGSAADRTINDAFAGIAGQLKLIMSDTASITVTLKDSAGTAIPGVLVQGILSENGQAVYSNTSGVAAGMIPEGSQTIKVTGYADIVDYAETISVTKGTSITKAITLTTRNFLKITSSRSVMFSGNVNTMDVTVVGGGGGGGGGGGSDDNTLAGGTGGGGGACVVQANVSFNANQAYPAVIGAGGSGADKVYSFTDSNNVPTNGGNGGASSFFGITANGGTGGGSPYFNNRTGVWRADAGEGNGNGGKGMRAWLSSDDNRGATAGGAGSTLGYASFTATARYGGGGAGGYSSQTVSGGADFGASYVGDYNEYTDKNGNSAAANTGGGGAGGGAYSGDDYVARGKGGKGGSGCVAIRMHLKSAA